MGKVARFVLEIKDSRAMSNGLIFDRLKHEDGTYPRNKADVSESIDKVLGGYK